MPLQDRKRIVLFVLAFFSTAIYLFDYTQINFNSRYNYYYGNSSVSYDHNALKELFKARQKTLRQACSLHFTVQPTAYRTHLKVLRILRHSYAISQGLYVDKQNRLVMCIIPKVASSTLKSLFLRFTNHPELKSIKSLNHSFIHNESAWPKNISFKHLRDYNNSEIMTILDSYVKVAWVRHPLLRLVSAWNSKLTGKNNHYMIAYGRNILRNYRNSSQVSANASVDIEEFFQFIKDKVSARKIGDVHWSTFHSQCMPCYMNYDYIIHLEKWYPEMYYMLKSTMATNSSVEKLLCDPEVLDVLTASHQSADDTWKRLINHLPTELVNSVGKNYRFDFELFGYNQYETETN